MDRKRINKLICIIVLGSLTVSQLGCSIAERMKEPIANFKSSTTVLTATAKRSYNTVNGPAVMEAMREAQLSLKRICNALPPPKVRDSEPADSETSDRSDEPEPIPCEKDEIDITDARTLSDEDMSARLDALQSLDNYADLLFKVVNSDAPEKIEASATRLQKSLDELAVRIAGLTEPNSRPGPGSPRQTNNAKFTKAFNLFSAVVREVLTIFARKKRDEALKKAIEDGAEPVTALLSAIEEDVRAFWMNEGDVFSDRVVAASRALNGELDAAKKIHDALGTSEEKDNNKKERKRQLDEAQLTRLRNDLKNALDERAKFEATDPSRTIRDMREAHTKMVEYARRPTSASFIESVRAIELFAASAARLGSAVVKLAEKDDAGR